MLIYKNRLIVEGPAQDVTGLHNLICATSQRDEVFTLESVLPVPQINKVDAEKKHARFNQCDISSASKFELYSDQEEWCHMIWGTPSDVFNTSIVSFTGDALVVDFFSEKSSPIGWANYLSENVPTFNITLMYNHHPKLEHGFAVFKNQSMIVHDSDQFDESETYWYTNEIGMPAFNFDKLFATSKETSSSPQIVLA